MKILIISYFFPPYNSIGSIRVGKTAKYLSQLGHDVYVISNNFSDIDESIPVEFSRNRHLKVDSLSFDRFINDEYFDYSSIKKILFRLKIALEQKNCRYLVQDPTWPWIDKVNDLTDKLFNEWRPELIYSSALPVSSHFIARNNCRKYEIPWIAEYRDLWSGDSGQGMSRSKSFVRQLIESWLLKPVHGIVTVSEPLAEYFETLYKVNTEVIYNGYDDSANDPDIKSKSINDKFRIVYTGNFYNGYDPSILFEAINSLGRGKEKVEVLFYSPQRKEIEYFIDKYDLDKIVKVKPLVPYEESLSIQKNADVLLFLSYTNIKYKGRGILSGKIFEYLQAEQPILSVGGDSDHLFIKEGLMKHYNSSDELSQRIKSWIAEKYEFGYIRADHNDEKKKIYSREAQTKKLDQFIQSIV